MPTREPIMQMTETDYLQQRLDDQINWYSTKSAECQLRYKRLRMSEIVSAAIIPFVSGMGDKVLYAPWIVGSLGIFIAIAAATGGLFKYHENWIQYRATSEALKHEKFLYLGRVVPYADSDSFSTLVQRIEGLISKENSTWTQAVKSDGRAGEKDAHPVTTK
jgi:hypothetical protein